MTNSVVTAVVLALALGGVPLAAAAEPDGEELYQLCTQCHGADGSGNELYLAPAIAGLGEWYIVSQLKNFRSGARGLHFDDLAGMRMRPMALTLRTETELASVAEYAGSLPPVRVERTLDGDPEKGQARYAPCAGCHGLDGKGNEMVFAPSLHTNDWYLLRQMQNYKAGVRGTNPLDVYGMAMRPMAMILPDDEAVRDVIAHVMSLSD